MTVREEIAAAIRAESAVSFEYRKQLTRASGRFPRRAVAPWEAGEDSFLGWDYGRDEIRRFRYDKVDTVARAVGGLPIELEPAETYIRPL